MHTLLIASRKGLFVVSGGASQWRITAHHFVGDAVSFALADPRDGSWYAALKLGHFGVKLRKSTDQGATWSEMAAPAFPAKPVTGPQADDPTPWNVELIWTLATGGADEPGTLWAGCLPAGLFKSHDGGASWQLNDALWQQPGRRHWFGGGYDHAGIHSILVDPRNARHLTLGISCGGVWQSHDGGAQWTLTAKGMKADYLPPESAGDENVQDPHCLVQCRDQPDVLWVQHHCGIYRSTDAGRSWQAVAAPVPLGFGFAVACDPRRPERAWFVPAAADARRIPVDAQLVVTRTDDGGRSFTSLRSGLPQDHAYHLVYRHALDVSADGQTLAMASTTGGLWVSADAGQHWQALPCALPPVASLRFL